MQTGEPVWLSAEEIAKTNSYFKSLASRSPSVAVSVQTLFGRCCLATFSDCLVGWAELGCEASALCDSILSHPEPNNLSLDPLPLIEIYTMLQAEGVTARPLGHLLDRIASELAKQSLEARSTGRVRYITSRLARAGHRMEIARPSKEASALLRSPESWFDLSATRLADLADHVIAEDRPLDEIPTRVISLIALSELRSYRVDLACKLLRAAFHLGLPCPEAADGLNFITLQRRRDGYYGFSNQLVESASSTADRHLSVYLPLTINAVWLFRIEAVSRQRLQSLLSV